MKPLFHRPATALLVLLAVITVACGRPDAGSRRAVIQNKGSDTLVNVAQAWSEAYQDINPGIAVAVSGGGSGTGFAALVNGTVDIANASRSIKNAEREQIEESGSSPVEYIVGYDALAVFVHANNPIDQFSLAQLTEIYGEGGTTESWTQLGIEVPGCRDQEIVRVSRQNNSGTYAYFRQAVLDETDFKLGSRDLHGSKDVVDLVQSTECAIGYSSFAYATNEVKMPCILTPGGGDCISPSIATALDGSYPIARPLFMYTIGEPSGAVKEYLDWILSDEGQCILQKKGYAPVKEVTCEAG